MRSTDYQHAQQILGKPKVKGRPRMTKTGHTYTPKKTVEYEAEVASQYDGPKFEGDIAMEIILGKDRMWVTINDMSDWENNSRLTGDIDNYAKSVLDALNGIAYEDDKQIKQLIVRKQ